MDECDKLYARLDALEEAISHALDDEGRSYLEARVQGIERAIRANKAHPNPIVRMSGGRDKARLKTFRRILKTRPRVR